MISDCDFKFIFYGDGLFDVVKERNEEVVVFSRMMIRFRLDFCWDEVINLGYVISFIIFYDYEIFFNSIEVSIVVYIKE